jgi:hypothetical protein
MYGRAEMEALGAREEDASDEAAEEAAADDDEGAAEDVDVVEGAM